MKTEKKNTPAQYDVVVCGGGIAGIAAALSAARTGARTILVEREYVLGGLATLGLIVIYLPLCDGSGVQMSGGIAEELLRLSIENGPGEVPPAWQDPQASTAERKMQRFALRYNAATLAINAEQALLTAGVKLLYAAHISGVRTEQNKLCAVIVESKTGPAEIRGHSFVDATGDADLCFFAGEPTISDPANRRTGWFFSYDGSQIKLYQLTDPLQGDPPPGSRFYSGTDLDDISQHCIDGRQMISEQLKQLRQNGNTAIYPLLIPSFHGLRMTRRLAGPIEFSDHLHQDVWFADTIGMIGNWKENGKRYSLPYRAIKAVNIENLYAAGRCISADESGWDLTRVIPSCAVTGQAAGAAAAIQSATGKEPSIEKLQPLLRKQGVLLNPQLFARQL